MTFKEAIEFLQEHEPGKAFIWCEEWLSHPRLRSGIQMVKDRKAIGLMDSSPSYETRDIFPMMYRKIGPKWVSLNQSYIPTTIELTSTKWAIADS